MAILKHIASKNANYGSAIDYLKYQHDEFHLVPVLDESGNMLLREEVYLDGLNCNPETFDLECELLNQQHHKNKRLCGLNYHSGFKAGTHAKWQAIQVLRILKNEVYTGTMVQGRRQKINYKIKKIRDVEESCWIKVPNMHEAIIPQKLFDTVQEVLKLDTCASKGRQTVLFF